ncbi:MAG: hypothetical protein JSV04_05040 [Candidatus Heimdallarchaeota archaeon]|nr:MAG: hypothetical protein JSV04_05040 [Candidatus Heimdallarchaeota archaeon]
MSEQLKDKLLKEFPGKMENEQAFIMQYVIKEAQQGNKPPSKEELQKCINEMISEGIFDKEGSLLILRATSNASMKVEELEIETEEEFQVVPTSSITGNYTETQKMILAAFQGKYENRTAIVMNATMAELSQGKSPPAKDLLEKSIDELISKGVLEPKGVLLIKKI